MTDQSEVMLIWQLNQALYNSSRIKTLALVMDGLGTQWMDPTRTKLASS